MSRVIPLPSTRIYTKDLKEVRDFVFQISEERTLQAEGATSAKDLRHELA